VKHKRALKTPFSGTALDDFPEFTCERQHTSILVLGIFSPETNNLAG
jgi:hypothetical protein